MEAQVVGKGSVGIPKSPRITRETLPLLLDERASVSRLSTQIARFISHVLVELPSSTWMLLDVSILTGLLYLAYQIYPPPELIKTPHVLFWQGGFVFAFGLMLASLVFGLYDRDTVMSRSRILTRVLLVATAATVISYAVIYVIMYATISRRVTGFSMSLFIVCAASLRLLACWSVHQLHRGILVVGSRALYKSFVKAQELGMLSAYKLNGYVSTTDPKSDDQSASEYHGTISEFVKKMPNHEIHDVVVGAAAARDPKVMDWVLPCLQGGCRVTNEAIFFEKATGQILVDEITPNWFLFADLKLHCDEHATMKRLFDLVSSIIGLCLSAPLWPIIALMIKLDDGGPVFYAQDRGGQNDSVFRLFKFRTMRTDAESGRSIWASPDDPRVTRVGRFLRKSRLDELPQLYNILMGQMSIVGPRPERPDIIADLAKQLPYYAERHLLKPGLTGWAQISYKYGNTIEDARRKLQYDLYYLKHMSFELDMMILFRTAGTFLRGAC